VDFLFRIIELFSLSVIDEERKYRLEIAILKGVDHFDKI